LDVSTNPITGSSSACWNIKERAAAPEGGMQRGGQLGERSMRRKIGIDITRKRTMSTQKLGMTILGMRGGKISSLRSFYWEKRRI